MAKTGFFTAHGSAIAYGIGAAAAVFVAGWKARDAVAEARAEESAKYAKIVETVNRLDKNMARVMDRLNIPPEPELPPAPSIRTSGPSR